MGDFSEFQNYTITTTGRAKISGPFYRQCKNLYPAGNWRVTSIGDIFQVHHRARASRRQWALLMGFLAMLVGRNHYRCYLPILRGQISRNTRRNAWFTFFQTSEAFRCASLLVAKPLPALRSADALFLYRHDMVCSICSVQAWQPVRMSGVRFFNVHKHNEWTMGNGAMKDLAPYTLVFKWMLQPVELEWLTCAGHTSLPVSSLQYCNKLVSGQGLPMP